MDVSVIIVNYNTSRLIVDCVESILQQTQGVSYEVIIVDNNSEADFEEKISKRIPDNFSSLFHFLSLPENIGFGRANNEGLKIATGRNIFFLNPDTVLINNAIKILSDFLDFHPKAGACGGNLYNADMQPVHSFRRFLPGIFCEFNELLNNRPQRLLFGKNSSHNHTSHTLKVGFITGADLMVKRSVLSTTGGFSKDFFLYYEETDLCYRIKKKGWEIYSVPEAKILHLESKSFSATEAYESEFKTQMLEKSRNIYYRRNINNFTKEISNLIYSMFLKSRAHIITNTRKKEYYLKRIKYFRTSK